MHKHKIPQETRDKVLRLFYKESLLKTTIAERLGISKTSVTNIIREDKLKKENPNPPSSIPSQLGDIKFYDIETRDLYPNIYRYRYVSNITGAKGLWKKTYEEATSDGEKHKEAILSLLTFFSLQGTPTLPMLMPKISLQC